MQSTSRLQNSVHRKFRKEAYSTRKQCSMDNWVSERMTEKGHVSTKCGGLNCRHKSEGTLHRKGDVHNDELERVTRYHHLYLERLRVRASGNRTTDGRSVNRVSVVESRQIIGCAICALLCQDRCLDDGVNPHRTTSLDYVAQKQRIGKNSNPDRHKVCS